MSDIIYRGHDNALVVILKENNTAISTTATTAMAITIGGVTIESTNGSTQLISWNKTTYVTGEVHLLLGKSTKIDSGVYQSPLVIYDADNPNGIVWGNLDLEVVQPATRSTST